MIACVDLSCGCAHEIEVEGVLHLPQLGDRCVCLQGRHPGNEPEMVVAVYSTSYRDRYRAWKRLSA